MTLDTPKAKSSYAIGLNIGKGMGTEFGGSGYGRVHAGIEGWPLRGQGADDGRRGEGELDQLQAHLRQVAEEKAKELGDANKKEGEEFLAANKAKEGVVTLPDGLQYKILTAGTGPKPARHGHGGVQLPGHAD